MSLSFATLSRFSSFLKDAIYSLDIPSRRPRLDEYSQKSTLYQLMDCAKCKVLFLKIVRYHLFQLYQAWSRAESLLTHHIA